MPATTYLKACINGARTPDQHPALPVTPDQLAAAAVQVHRAGAQAVHMHPKTSDGVDSLQPDVVDAAVSAVRHAIPGLPLGVTTGYWVCRMSADGGAPSKAGGNCPTSHR